MILARIIGNLTATQKNILLVGAKIMVLQPIDVQGNPAGDEFIAVDGVGAGIGDTVLAIAEGGSARQVYKSKSPMMPIDTVIAGIVDSIDSPSGK